MPWPVQVREDGGETLIPADLAALELHNRQPPVRPPCIADPRLLMSKNFKSRRGDVVLPSSVHLSLPDMPDTPPGGGPATAPRPGSTRSPLGLALQHPLHTSSSASDVKVL